MEETKRPAAQYRVIAQVPRCFFMNLPFHAEIAVGEVCTYFEHTDVYLFEKRNGSTPYVKRSTVERWSEYFEEEKQAEGKGERTCVKEEF